LIFRQVAGTGRYKTSLQPLLQLCEEFYKRDGFVSWSDVARALDVSRQAVQGRLKQAVECGELDTETFERFRSMSSRRAAARQNEEERRNAAKLTVQVGLTPENGAWLRAQCELRRITTTDIINGLITKARLQPNK
jgi:predicted DNA-binding protein YlxM (UPF0122 family)